MNAETPEMLALRTGPISRWVFPTCRRTSRRSATPWSVYGSTVHTQAGRCWAMGSADAALGDYKAR